LTDIKRKDAAGSIKFAFDVGKRTSQRWVDTGQGSSYEYTIKSVISVVKHDPLADMRKALAALPYGPQKALAGPKSSES
jgi:hypothetical protein